MRRYIRHPFDIPIDFRVTNYLSGRENLVNFSAGGLCFHSRLGLAPGTTIKLHIPIQDPPFEAMGRVSWCHSSGSGFEIGVRFSADVSVFALRMVEQICYIEQYRLDMRVREGRRLTREQAASEWISYFAKGFPD